MSAPAFAKTKSLKVRPNAPKRYVVKQGDTLWGVSGKYLYRPHQWPSLWNVNRAKIRNPHLIYPGQVLYLTYVNGRPVLRVGKGASGRRTGGFVKLRPSVRDMGSGYGIQTLDVDFYRLFMKHPQFVSDKELKHAPRIVAGPDGRDIYTATDRIYADGLIEPGEYLIFRVSQDLKDPTTGKSLGKLVEFSGEAVTLNNNNSALANRDSTTALDGLKPKVRNKLEAKLGSDEYYVKSGEKLPTAVRTAVPMIIEVANTEIQRGDYLIRKPDVMSQFNAMPHEPDAPVEARIISVMDGISEAGMGQSIILNKGLADGVDEGTVLSVYKGNRLVQTEWNNPNRKATKTVSLPTEESALVMVYRAADNVSSAIVLESKSSVSTQDIAREPGQDLETFDDAAYTRDSLIEHDKKHYPK